MCTFAAFDLFLLYGSGSLCRLSFPVQNFLPEREAATDIGVYLYNGNFN